MIYGIIGPKFSGKDTFATLFTDIDVHITHFADNLKNKCSTVFGVPLKYFVRSDLKESKIDPIVIDNYLSDLNEATGLKITPKGLVADTPRLLLQYVGTEYVRATKDSYWLDLVRDEIQHKNLVLIPDTRFKNEIDLIRSLSGKIIKIVRLDMPKSEDSHKSEQELVDFVPDLVIGTLTNKYSLPKLIALHLQEGGFDRACWFDYRRLIDPEFEKTVKGHPLQLEESYALLRSYYPEGDLWPL
jgi:hypothetical protein